ncbi:hypothetical protein [Streptomyces synnematoformans]|uniref:hypothetical protein n=1 Tax=Streptomyces synnematoformans TaxID=415721 RepID=UPI0031E068AA
MAEELSEDGTVAAVRPTVRAGHKTLVAALASDGTPLAVGHYHPANDTAEIGGIGTLPSHVSANRAVQGHRPRTYDVLRADALSARESVAPLGVFMEGYGHEHVA